MRLTSGIPCRWLALLLLVTVTAALASCSPGNPFGADAGTPLVLDEPFRPRYHFTPAAAWMNDPNGLVFYDGAYHLFYQHNPHDTVWGPMHWGHAISPDLVNWQHLPIAIYPDDIGTIFSGSAVIDWHNTAGFGEEAMVAIFTHDASGRQMQSIAYSTDEGETWTKYHGNPVIEPPNNIRNFRDPKVFWYEQGDGAGHWVMVISAGTISLFYKSSDLKEWQAVGGFGPGFGATCGVWETPELFQLPVDGGPEMRWVLAVAIGDCAPAGGSGVQYFVGDFDGETFTSENSKDTVLWVDYGADFYAPQSWNNAPDDRRVWAAWMNNWRYAQDIPTSTWRGALTIPRDLSLTETAAGARLRQQPVAALNSLRDEAWFWENETITPETTGLLAGVGGEALELSAEFRVESVADQDRFGVRLHSDEDEETVIGYASKSSTLFVDRSNAGKVDFNPAFSGIHTAVMEPVNGIIRLHILVDRSSVELFGNDGQVVFTERIFPTGDRVTVELFVDGGSVTLNSLDIYRLDAATILGQQEVAADPAE